ncbi:hypothetical protein BDR26DRAFT_936537 [Obelidium mucronatum]|nr:hypothetical protein BDR26DRAFT_936537 [Obelidium mucronatum]
MPSLRFNRRARILTIIPTAAENLVSRKSRIKISYNHIKLVTARPAIEAFALVNGVEKGKALSQAHARDLHLYKNSNNVVQLDLTNHLKYQRIFFEIPYHSPWFVAKCIQREVGMQESKGRVRKWWENFTASS